MSNEEPRLETHWHHECTNPECGIMMTFSFERENGGEPVPMPAPKSDGEFSECPICKQAWGPWKPGPAPELEPEDDLDYDDDYDEDEPI